MHAAKPKSRLDSVKSSALENDDVNGRRTKTRRYHRDSTSLPRAVGANAPAAEVVMRVTIPTAVAVFRGYVCRRIIPLLVYAADRTGHRLRTDVNLHDSLTIRQWCFAHHWLFQI